MGAVVFDLDGLLIDSEPFWRQAEIEVFARVGLDLTESDVRQTMGLRIDDAVRHWWDRRPWTGACPVEVERAVTARVAELIATAGSPMPGALEAIDLCGRLSLPVAVCSGSYAMVIEAALARLGIAPSMSAWHSAEWEPLGKPHPGAYLTTAAKLGVDPTACLAVEDSFNGAISAKAARMRVVAVPEPGMLDSPRGVLRPRARLPHRLRRGRAPLPREVTGSKFRFGNRPHLPIHMHEGHSLGRGTERRRPVPVAGRAGRVARVSRCRGALRVASLSVAMATTSGRETMPVRIGVLASGSGTILEAILAAGLPVRLVVADRPCRALDVAVRASVPARPRRPGRLRRLRGDRSTGRVTPGRSPTPWSRPRSTWW